MRISKTTIEKEGKRLSSHSKFYFWEENIWEPCFYNNKKTGTYKMITEIRRANKIFNMYGRKINKKTPFSKFDIIDFDE
jgi:hypothetical protein